MKRNDWIFAPNLSALEKDKTRENINKLRSCHSFISQTREQIKSQGGMKEFIHPQSSNLRNKTRDSLVNISPFSISFLP